MSEPMKFAYADPPYLGCASYYKAHHPDAMIWNKLETHRALIERLQDEFPDGWAMSLSEKSLRVILPMCPQDARTGWWISEQPRFANKIPVQHHIEPVIWTGGRGWEGASRTRDFLITKQRKAAPEQGWLSAYESRRKGPRPFLGTKTLAFCEWIFDLLGAGPGDEFHDLFPGSGAVSAAWAKRIGVQPDLPLTPLEKIAAEAANG